MTTTKPPTTNPFNLQSGDTVTYMVDHRAEKYVEGEGNLTFYEVAQALDKVVKDRADGWKDVVRDICTLYQTRYHEGERIKFSNCWRAITGTNLTVGGWEHWKVRDFKEVR